MQNTTTYNAKQQSAGASVSVYIPPTEQSGIKAGDGGFQVAVKKNDS